MPSGVMYPGTFDPLTNGHAELIRRAATTFGRVIVAVAASPSKTPLFSLDERIAMIESIVGDIDGVSVAGYTGLTVEFAREHDLQAILRGLRAASDFEYEFQLATMNRHLASDIETVFLTPTEEFMFVSSTLVREIAALGGDVSGFVPPEVNRALRERFPGSQA
jgi:pantetheine-phosphate adenylyltransferase